MQRQPANRESRLKCGNLVPLVIRLEQAGLQFAVNSSPMSVFGRLLKLQTHSTASMRKRETLADSSCPIICSNPFSIEKDGRLDGAWIQQRSMEEYRCWGHSSGRSNRNPLFTTSCAISAGMHVP